MIHAILYIFFKLTVYFGRFGDFRYRLLELKHNALNASNLKLIQLIARDAFYGLKHSVDNILKS